VIQGLLIAVAGLAIGASLGLLGAGGTILTVPVLLLLGVEPKPAIAMSLLVVAATALAAAAGHWRAGSVDWRAAAAFGPATALGGFAGGRTAAYFRGEVLLLVFTALMIAAAIAMLRSRPVTTARGRSHPLWLALGGAAIGAIAGLVGAGGGFLFVPAFVFLGGMPIERAVGTSLVVIALNAGAALAGHLGHIAIRFGLASALTGAAIVGAWGGALLAHRTPERRLRRAFGTCILLIAIWMLARSPLVHQLLAP
jgi:uncharacterized membrane protein YfcA